LQDLKKLSIEARLSAYMDGEASREEKEDLERLLAADPEARRILALLKHGSDVGCKAFDEVLKEPVPLAIVRSIKSVQPPKQRESPRLAKPSVKLAPTGKQALAASLILFALGTGLGYMLGIDPGGTPANPPVVAAPSRAWIDDLAAFHRVYSHQPHHMAEVPASDGDEILKWLTASVGVKFNIPDLATDGLVFQGARLLVAGGKPVGQLIYKGVDGDVIAISFLKDDGAQDNSDFDEKIKDDVGVVSWHRAGVGYAIVGPSSDAMLNDLANRVSSEI
jgi:anti-sigma factor RsiW